MKKSTETDKSRNMARKPVSHHVDDTGSESEDEKQVRKSRKTVPKYKSSSEEEEEENDDDDDEDEEEEEEENVRENPSKLGIYFIFIFY